MRSTNLLTYLLTYSEKLTRAPFVLSHTWNWKSTKGSPTGSSDLWWTGLLWKNVWQKWWNWNGRSV